MDVKLSSPSVLPKEKIKGKRKSLIERELETNLTPQAISPKLSADGQTTSRYGRMRRSKTETDFYNTEAVISKLNNDKTQKTPCKSPAYKMHASLSPINKQDKNNAGSSNAKTISPAKKFPKVYVRKDLIEGEETEVIMKNIFSPKSKTSQTNSGSAEKYDFQDTHEKQTNQQLSVVKVLDFESKKINSSTSKLSEIDFLHIEGNSKYQVGDLLWARMGTYPFWPCIITKEPTTGLFIKRKLFGRIERDILHVTFFADNGRRSWVVESMVRPFTGLSEFEAARDSFTVEKKKNYPKSYHAFLISEKKRPQWEASVEEAEILLKEPKRLRIDIFYDMIGLQVTQETKSGAVKRTDSDVSLSESLYDTLFSEEDCKSEDAMKTKSIMRKKSLDVSDVVTACLDNMAAKTGLTRIKKQSHMDIWLQKAKSKTPEKNQGKSVSLKQVNGKSRTNGIKTHKKAVKGKIMKTNSALSMTRYLNGHQETGIQNGLPQIEDNFVDDSHVCGIGIISKVESLQGKDAEEIFVDSKTGSSNAMQNGDLTDLANETTDVNSTNLSEFVSKVDIDTVVISDVINKDNDVKLNGCDHSYLDINGLNDITQKTNPKVISKETESSVSILENNFNIESSTFKDDDKLNDVSVSKNIETVSRQAYKTTDHDNSSYDRKNEFNDLETIEHQQSDVKEDNNNDLLNNTESANNSDHVNANLDTESAHSNNENTNCDSMQQELLNTGNEIVTEVVDNLYNDLKEKSPVEKLDIEELHMESNCNGSVIDSKVTNSSIDSTKSIVDKEVTINGEDKQGLSNEKLEQDAYISDKLKENVDIDIYDKMLHNCPKSSQYSAAKGDDELKINNLDAEKSELNNEINHENVNNVNEDMDTSTEFSENHITNSKPKQKDIKNKKSTNDLRRALQDTNFLKYLMIKKDNLMDEHPELTEEEAEHYLYNTWLYEEGHNQKSNHSDEVSQTIFVDAIEDAPSPPPKKTKKKVKPEKQYICTTEELNFKDKPKRQIAPACYNEDSLDLEDEIASFEIPNYTDEKETETQLTNPDLLLPVTETKPEKIATVDTNIKITKDKTILAETYFAQLTKPKPNIFKGLAREKVCDVCANTGNLIKCKNCHLMFHYECTKDTGKVSSPTQTKSRGRKRKKKYKSKSTENTVETLNDKNQDGDLLDETQNMSIDELVDETGISADAEYFETKYAENMKTLLENKDTIIYYTIKDANLSNDNIQTADFKCHNCQHHNIPICTVCKSSLSPKGVESRQKCQIAHCNSYYHVDCLEHWPQAHFSSSEKTKSKAVNEHSEALTCPRHVCHTCVSDDPRGCKTRFSGDKLARCIRCPATYHSFTKCVPAGTKILTASHIICPRHYQHRSGKTPCHVNTGWCFICALGGTLICCEYCPTSFHAECLNMKPPEGGYMCEDCETGRLPLYGEMVWVKLGQYRWWPGMILHPSEVPPRIMETKHTLGEFVVRFFGQYDHYWVNRGRVFPFQEGDTGRVSSRNSKIDAAFSMAIDHARRACEILKSASPAAGEDVDIASSLLPPHYVKLKTNKPYGAVCARKYESEANSLTQCDCDPDDDEPCGVYSSCLNRMLLTECGPSCRAGDRCCNRAFEKRQYPKMAPYRTPHRGWGLKALEDIKQGQFVIEYVGELIDEQEFQRRMRRKYETRDENFYFLTLDKERMIDAGPKGNLARFMNHSCEPNCETQKWTVLDDVRVGLFAMRDIPANSELNFNYNLECSGIEKKRCLCGAPRCAGYIGAKAKQEDQQQRKQKAPSGKRVYKKKSPQSLLSPSGSHKRERKSRQNPLERKRELTELEKDVLIIKSATNCSSSDSESTHRGEFDRKDDLIKRKRVSFSAEQEIFDDCYPPIKKVKLNDDL